MSDVWTTSDLWTVFWFWVSVLMGVGLPALFLWGLIYLGQEVGPTIAKWLNEQLERRMHGGR